MKKIFILFLLLGLLVGIGFFLTKQFFHTKGISGIVDLNGIVPPGSTLIFYQKLANSQDDFSIFAENVPAQDRTPWHFPAAQSGESYELQVVIVLNNNVITQSSPIFVTAPAQNEALTLNVTSDHLVSADVATPTPGGNAVISGTVGVNGYIPQGATITVEGRSLGKNDYTAVASNLAAVDNQIMTYATAIPGQTYEVRGFMYDSSGNQIGSSNVITITAPASNEVLNINSTAQAPVTPTPTASPQAATQPPAPATGAISGTINFNGQAPPNTRIVVFQRVTGTSQFQLAQDNIPPVSGSTWSWTGNVGTSYDLIGILKQKQNNGSDTDISDSNIITVAAPASNEVFTINSGFSLPAASGNITVTCNNYNSGNQTWQAFVSYQSITGAQSYWFQIGITNGGIELTNSTYNSTNNPSQSYQYTFNNNTTYYARYAYAAVPNLLANSSEFSPFSSTQQLRCSN